MNDTKVSVPEPARIQFPWNESSRRVILSSNRNFVRECISPTEVISGVMEVPNALCQEKKLRTVTPVLRIGNSNNENLPGEKIRQCETEDKIRTNNPDCAVDNRDSRRVEILYSSEYQRYQEIPGSKSVILHDYIDVEKHSALVDTSDRSHSFDDQFSETIPESSITARIPSPSSASSITSGRRLEWDSGADVGYHFIQDNNFHSASSLSTIERIALARGCSAALFERLDPEGVSGPPKPVLAAQILCDELDSPVAKSTPIYKAENKPCSRSVKTNPVTPIVEPTETVLPGGYLYLHSGEEFENDVAPPPGNGSGEQNEDGTDDDDDDKIPVTDNLNKKHSNSLINLSSSHEEMQCSMPRSQSYLNLLNRDASAVQQPCTLAATCSVSSSSVATIVQKPMCPKTSDKFIQTLPLKMSVGVQVSESMDHTHPSQKSAEVVHNVFSSVVASCDNQNDMTAYYNNESQNHRCSGAHKKGYIVNNHCYQLKKSNSVDNNLGEKSKVQVREKENSQAEEFHTSEKNPSTLDSAASSSQTVESSCVAETSGSGLEVQREGQCGSTGVVDSANSFEYLPGHVFEKAYKCQNDASKRFVVPDTNGDRIQSKSNIPTETIGRPDSRSSSLSRDIEEGVELLQRLMSEKSYNGKMKKKLIRQIVNKLVNTDYPEDYFDKDQVQSIPLSSNIPWVPAAPGVSHVKSVDAFHYLSVGEKNNKCRRSLQNVGGCSNSEGSKDRSVESATSEIHSSPSSCTPSGSLSVPGDNEQSQPETSERSSNVVSDNSRRNWKLPTTITEKDFERNQARSVKNDNSTPPLLQLCKSEHEKQLQWIRFEIDHLSHLKQLLEKQEEVTRTLSNLADHEHKFHKIVPADKKRLRNNKFQRSKAKGCENWSNSTVCSSGKDNASSQSNASLKAHSSSSLSYQEPFLSDIYHHSQSPKGEIPQLQNPERVMRKTENKHNLSTQTLTLDSYVLQNVNNTSSDVKGLSLHSRSSNDGRLNVYVQTSPNALKKQEKASQNVAHDAKASQNTRSYESAVKCCCDCRRALKELAHRKKKGEQIQPFCRCKCASSESDHIVTDSSYSFEHSKHSTAQSRTPESNNTDRIHLPEKRDTATEIIVDNIQTKQSFSRMPIIETLWNQETYRNVPQKEENKFCPCCGLHERMFESDERQDSQEKSKKTADVESKLLVGGGGRTTTISDASIQTSNKEPFAYLLTFEPTSKENVRTQSNESLPEIKLLVPVSENRLENEMKKKASSISQCKENRCPTNNVQPMQQESNSLGHQEGGGKKVQKLTLQEYLQANRPDYILHADKRSQCLADLALLRDLRKQKRLELMAMTSQPENEKPKDVTSNERIVFTCAAVPSKPKITSRPMREQSRRKYHKTREVQNKLVEKKKKEDFRTNRLMAELFTKKLQKKVLQGVVNHSCSASVISSGP